MIDTQSVLFRLSGDIIFACNEMGVITEANPAASRLLRVSYDSLVGHALIDFVPTVQTSMLQTRLSSARAKTEPETFALEFLKKDSPHLIAQCSIQFDAATKSFAIIATPFMSMPENEHNRWRLALESTDAGYWGSDFTSGTMYFSSRLETMLGYEAGSLSPSVEVLMSFVHPDDRELAERETEKFRLNPNATYRFEFRLIKKDGSTIWVLSMGGRRSDTRGHQIGNGWYIDITDLKIAEMRLKESEERSRALLQTLPDIIFVNDRDGNYIEVHSTDQNQLIQPAETLIGRNMSEYVSAELLDRTLVAIRKAIDFGERTTFEYELDLPLRRSYFEARFAPNYDGNTALVIIRNVTDGRLAQIAKQESDERLRAFIANFPATVFNMKILPSGEAYYTYVGGNAEEEFEISGEEMVGRPLVDTRPPFIHPEDAQSAGEALSKSVASMSGLNWTGRFVLPSGKIRWSNTIGTPHLLHDGSILFSAISIDVSQQLHLAQKVRDQQAAMTSSARLTALGEMAGGIAHEINNPLTVAHAHAARLRDLAYSGKDLDRTAIAQAAEKIEAVCMRISRIIAGLRSIARDGDSDRFTKVPLAPVVNDALSLISEKLRHRKIEFHFETVSPALTIECRSVQVSQILVNLLLNAQHAVEGKKTERWVKLNVIETGSSVEIRVSDSGAGVTAAIREKIFDPFFTTKDVGKGTGLGLSVSASIAQTHGGSLFLDETQPNTTFVLRLPKRQLGQ